MPEIYTYEYIEGQSSTVAKEEMYGRQSRHDDLRIRARFIEYDKNHDNMTYMTYIIDKREDDGEWERYVKVVKMCKTYNVPKELREKKALMVSQDELLSAVWKDDINFLCVYCNMPEDKGDENGDGAKKIHGFYYLYGVQCVMRIYGHYYGTGSLPVYYDENTSEAEKVAQTLKVLKEQADAKFSGLLKLLRGNFRQAQFNPLTRKEAEAIRETIENAPYLQVIRGIPKTHISAASGVTTSMDGVTTTPEGIEQNEEFIRGLLHDRYANIIMAVPIPHDEIIQWSDNTAKELSKYKSQYSGMISHNAGVSIPMVFAGNLSATLGNTQGITDTNGVTTGTTEGTTDSVSKGTGTSDSRSHSVGYSNGQSIGIADSTSQATTDSSSQGLSRSRTLSDSVGVSQTESNGFTHGVTNTESYGRSHTVGQSETFGESETLSRTRSHSIGQSATIGHTSGETLGQTQGLTSGHTVGNTHGTSLTQGHTVGDTTGRTLGLTQGETTGTTLGHTVGNTLGHTVGNTLGHTEGNTLGHTVGNTLGHTVGNTLGHTVGNTLGHTVGDTLGHTVGDTTGHTTGNTYGQTTGLTYGHTTGTTMGHTVGNTYGTTAGDTYGLTQGQTIGQTVGNTHGTTITDGSSISNSSSYGGSHSASNGVSTSNSIGNSTNLTQTSGHTIGSTATNGTSQTIGRSSNWTDSTTANFTNSGGVSGSQGSSRSQSFNNNDSYGANSGLNASVFGVGGNISETSNTGVGSGDNFGNTYGTNYNGSSSFGGGVSHGAGGGVTDSRGATSSYGATDSNSFSKGYSQGVTQSQGNGTSQSVSDGSSWSNGVSNGTTHSVGQSNSQSISNSTSNSLSQSHSQSVSHSLSQSASDSLSRSASDSMSQSRSNSVSHSISDSQSHSISNSQSHSISNSQSHSISDSQSRSISDSQSRSISDSMSRSLSDSQSRSISDSMSRSLSDSTSRSMSDSLSHSRSDSHSRSLSDSLSRGLTDSLSDSRSLSNSLSNSHSLSRSTSLSQGVTEGWSDGISHGFGKTHSVGSTVSDGVTQSVSRGVSDSTSQTRSEGLTRSQSVGNSIGRTDSLSHGVSNGIGKTSNQGLSRSLSDSQGVTTGTSTSDSRSNGRTVSASNSLSNSQGLSSSKSNALGSGQGFNFGLGPTIGVSRSYQIFDERKGNLIKLLEVSNTRWNLAVRMGAFHVDSYVVSYSPASMQGIALSSVTSWGGDNEIATVQCVTPGELTQHHLLKHVSVFEPCTMKDNTPGIADNYVWSTIMLTSELAAMTHLPRVESGGISTIATNIPPFSVFANKNGEIFFGKQINYEDGLPSYSYSFSKQEFMHTLICGASGCGKTTSAVRMAREVIRNYPDMKIFALDWKNSWRVLKRFAPNDVDDFEFYGLDYTSVRPIKMNLFIPPKHVGIMQWADKVIESICLGYGFGNKMYGVLKNAARISMLINGVMVLDHNGSPSEVRPKNSAEQALLNQNIAKVTLRQVYEIVSAMKEGQLKDGTSLATCIACLPDPNTRDYIRSKFAKPGNGMMDAFDSILTKLEPYFVGELRDLYCVENYDQCIHIEDLIDGKRIVVLEGGDLDGPTKKAVIQLISWGLFMYSRLKKNREKIVEKRFYILEEAHRVIDNPNSKSGAPVLDVGENIFEILLNEAREYGVYCMVIVQTPSALPPALITNCAILIIHRLGNDEDIQLMTTMLCRNARLDNRDVPIFLAKMPIGWAAIRLNNRPQHQDSEPSLVAVARCENEPPDDEELILDLPDVALPGYVDKRMNDSDYLQLEREELDAFIEHKDNPIDRSIAADDYESHVVAV